MQLTEAMSQVAATRAADPLNPVTFVTPTRVAALAMRRELVRLTPHAAVRFETLPRLAELIGSGSLAAQGRRPMARPIGDYAAGVVARESGGVLARVAELPGYARVLRRHFQRLRRGGIRSSADLAVAADGEATAEFLRAYDRFRELTADFYDDEDLFDAAAVATHAGHAGVAAELGDVFIVPPGGRTAGGEAFVRAIEGAGSRPVTLTDNQVSITPAFVLMPDPASEAESVARTVLRLLESGARLHEVAVFHGADRSYSPLLASVFARAGVPTFRSPGQPLTETPAGRAVLALLQIPIEDYSRVAVMDLFALAQSPRTLPATGQSVTARPTSWDRLSREAGVTHGANRWREALSALAGEMRDRATAEENEAWRERIEDEAATADALTAVVGELIARLEPLRAEQPARRFLARLTSLVEDYLRPDAMGFAEVIQEVEQLGTVGAIGGSFNLTTFTAALEANLRAATIRQGSLADGVLIADYRSAAGFSFPHVIICGAYEGAFPSGATVEAVVDDAWWAAARARHPWIEDNESRLVRERAAAVRALASATSSLTVTVPMAAAAGTRDRYPSPVVAEVASARLGHRVTPTDIRNTLFLGTVRGRSPLAAAATGPVLDAFEHELRYSLAARQSGPFTLPAGHRFARAAELRRMRRASRLSEWDGLVQLGAPLLPTDRQLSATSIESYSQCGFRFFLKNILGLRALDEPEERQTIDPAMRGTIVHKVLQLFFEEERKHNRPVTSEAWNAADAHRLLAILDGEMEKARVRGQAGLPIFHAHEIATLHADLERFLKEDSLHRAIAEATPTSFEWEFNQVIIGGRPFRGSADRVDRSPDGKQAWIIDYKTGSKYGYTENAADPFNGGKQLQLGIYAAALTVDEDIAVTGRYWFITQRGEFETVEYTHSAENASRLNDIVKAIDSGISSGAFPAVPGDEDPRGGFANCRYCDFDRICSRRRLADFTIRAADETLVPWARIAMVATGNDDE